MARLLDDITRATSSNKSYHIEQVLGADWKHARDAAKERKLLSIDLTKLAPGRKRARFEGVLKIGRKYVANALNPATRIAAKLPGFFDTAEEAAEARRQHYLANKWPYGEAETEVERTRAQIVQMGIIAKPTELQVLRDVLDYHSKLNYVFEGLEEIEDRYDAIREPDDPTAAQLMTRRAIIYTAPPVPLPDDAP